MDDVLLAPLSLADDINKAKGKEGENKEGVVTDYLPELDLDMTDEELLKLLNRWKEEWENSAIKSDWFKHASENEKYWLGRQYSILEMEQLRPLVDNLIFEVVETFLPAATKQNPEPLVELKAEEDQSKENLAYVELIRNRLADIADEIKLRLKIKRGARNWLISLIGAAKMGWDLDNNRPAVKILRPQKLIFDPDGVNDEDGYSGTRIGEYRKMEASVLEKIVPEKKAYIDELSHGEKGTTIEFIEWWTQEYTCWQCENEILLKKKNPHWNYDKQNHFTTPRVPYIFLTIFNLGKGPVDDTSLIGQNLSNQDLINKRLKQIDKNADSMNNGLVVSEERSGLTKEEAKGVTDALRRGGTIVIPSGAPSDAVGRFSSDPLPADVFRQLGDTIIRMRDTFGVRGITPTGIENDDTVRGKIITKGLDTDRIGGGITEYLEQFADDIFNWMVQILYVYDQTIQQGFAGGAQVPKIKVSVKEGSLLPKDATTIANQAIELAGGGRMALIDLYKRLEYPDPEEMAANVWLEANAPQLLYQDNPLVQQAIQMMQQKQEKPPSESISFKDLPPEGQAQMAKQAGIELQPENIIAHEQQKQKADILAKVSIGKPQG